MLNITNIPAPRVPFIEERTGLISREWYRFLLNLFQLTGGGNNQTSLDDLQVGPDAATFVVVVEQSLESLRQQVETQAPDQMAELDQLIDIIRQELQTLPRAELGTISAQNSDNVNITGGLISGLRSPLPIASGGTNSTSTPTAGAVAYGTGTTYSFTAAGTSGQVLTSAGASVPTWTTPTTGTVTSVGLAMPTQFTVTNSPVTSSGTLTADWNTQTANYVLAGPTTGAAALPTFRALVAADIPTLSYVTSVSGTTGQITSTGGTTPVIDLASGIATPGTTGSSTLIPVITIDTYGRVTSITTAANPQGTVTSVTGTSPVVSSGGATPAISLAAAYGDTLNPYASKTANFVLAAPNGLAGVPTFRALVAADVPTLNQNTTGSAATLTTPRAIYGNNFDGSAALTQIIASTFGGTGNGFTKFTGATTAEKTYTLPDASSTIVVQGGALGTPSSGTVTNLTGTASININGTVGATTASTGAFTTLSATGVTTVQAGTAALPAITTSGDTNTGIFFPAADTVGVSTGGSERFRVDSAGNLLVGASGTANGKVHISGSVIYTVPATFSASIGNNAAWTTGFGSQAINLSLWASSGIGGVSVYNVSDRRLKKDIKQLTGQQALAFISAAKPVQFVWKNEEITDTGFIAQDVLAAGFGHLVSMIQDASIEKEIDENGNESPAGSRFVMKYDSIIPILTAAIQEQQSVIALLKARLDAANL